MNLSKRVYGYWSATLLSFCLFSTGTQADQSELWQSLQNNPDYVVLMRHALAPGFSDPSEFKLRDCSTQRDLSEAGRQQARDIGALFRSQGIASTEVYSSQWCRCLHTAEELALGPVQELPVLNSFFTARDRSESQTNELKRWILNNRSEQLRVLVTHQVNISALTGVYPSSGALVVVKATKNRSSLEVVGMIETLELAQ